jgi:hypothetical protein
MGVDGFRLDAIPYLIERDGTSNENLRETHDVIKQIRTRIDAKYPGRLLLAEANMWPEDVREYFGDDDECHMAYHFPLMPRMYMAIAQEDRHPVVEILAQTPDIPPNCQWAVFLRNHDELTLEMVTSKERDYMYSMYAADSRARINLGHLAPVCRHADADGRFPPVVAHRARDRREPPHRDHRIRDSVAVGECEGARRAARPAPASGPRGIAVLRGRERERADRDVSEHEPPVRVRDGHTTPRLRRRDGRLPRCGHR